MENTPHSSVHASNDNQSEAYLMREQNDMVIVSRPTPRYPVGYPSLNSGSMNTSGMGTSGGEGISFLAVR